MATAKQKYEQAVHLIRDRSDFGGGRQLLIEALREEPEMADAWYWLARTITDPAKQRDCLDRALKFNPNHAEATKLRDRVEFQLLNAPPPEEAPVSSVRTGVTGLLGGTRLAGRIGTGLLQSKDATGPLNTGKTGSLDAKAATGPLNAKAATGPLNAGKTGPLNAKAATGLLNAGKTGPLNAKATTGPLNAGKTGTLNAKATTGTLNAGKTGPLNRAGTTGRLNEPLTKLQGTFKLRGGELGGVLLGLLVMVVLTVAAIIALPQFTPQLGLPPWVTPVLVVIAVLTGLAALALLYKLFMMVGIQLDLYENGLAYTRSGQRTEWKWAALGGLRVVEGVFGSSPFAWEMWYLQLFDRDGKEALRFNKEIKDYLKAAGIIDRLTTTMWLDESWEAFQRGRVVSFGPVNISAAGIERGNERVRFDDIESWNVRRGEIMTFAIKNGKNPVLIPVKDVPNRAVLVRLVDKVLGIDGR
jgi:hypothetical protein